MPLSVWLQVLLCYSVRLIFLKLYSWTSATRAVPVPRLWLLTGLVSAQVFNPKCKIPSQWAHIWDAVLIGTTFTCLLLSWKNGGTGCFAVFTGMRSGEQVDVEIMTLFGLYDISLVMKVAGVCSCNMRYEIVNQVYFLILGSSKLFTVYEFAPVIKGWQLLSEPGVLWPADESCVSSVILVSRHSRSNSADWCVLDFCDRSDNEMDLFAVCCSCCIDDGR